MMPELLGVRVRAGFGHLSSCMSGSLRSVLHARFGRNQFGRDIRVGCGTKFEPAWCRRIRDTTAGWCHICRSSKKTCEGV